jgi:hypothetical protein
LSIDRLKINKNFLKLGLTAPNAFSYYLDITSGEGDFFLVSDCFAFFAHPVGGIA